MTLQIEFDPKWQIGDIIKIQGKNHRITKKTTTAVAVERCYWFDQWFDKLERWANSE